MEGETATAPDLRGRLRRGTPRLVAAVLGAWLALAGTALAEPIAGIELRGNEFISREAFLALTDVEVGDAYDEQALQREFWKIWDSGLFEDVKIESAPAADGGRVVIFTVREKPRIESVTYEKTKVVDLDRIQDVLRQNDALITPNSTLDQEKVSKTKRILEELFASEGHSDARVTVVQREVGGSRVSLDFRIDPGPKTKIDKIEFRGNTVFGEGKLKDLLQNTSEHGLLSFISDKDVYYRPRFEEDLQAIRDAYRAKGYLDVEIGTPTVSDARPNKSGKEERQLVTLVVPITEGQPYSLGHLSVSGNTIFGSDTLRPLVPLAEGETLNDALLKLGISRIDQKYGDAGYLYAVTSPRYDKHPESHVADVDVQVTENSQYTIRRIDFDGNTQTRDAVLRREMRIQEGDVFSRRDYLISLRKIAQLGFWELEGEPTVTPVEGEDQVDITVRGKEVGRNEIQFGGGYSGVDGFFGTFSFSSRNFMGRGAQLSVSGQIGGDTTRYSLNYVEPYFMKSRATVGGAIFAREEDYSGFQRDGRGATLFWSYPTSTFSAVRVTGSWERSEIVADSTSAKDSRYTTYSVAPSYTFDNRDNPFRPTRGVRFSTALELGASKSTDPSLPPEYQQDTINYLKPRLGYTQYWRTFKKQYAGIHFEAGMLTALDSGGPDHIGADGVDAPFLPVFERYFLGGERSIRAVETRSVGPRVRQYTPGGLLIDDLALGGDQYYLLNLEYSIPFSKMFELTGFIDMGNAYGVNNVDVSDVLTLHDGDDIVVLDSDPFDVKATAGIELRFHTPVLQQPLRLIYGCKVTGDFFDDQGNCDFQFSIGRTFQ